MCAKSDSALSPSLTAGTVLFALLGLLIPLGIAWWLLTAVSQAVAQAVAEGLAQLGGFLHLLSLLFAIPPAIAMIVESMHPAWLAVMHAARLLWSHLHEMPVGC